METISLLGLYNQDDTILNSTNFPLPSGMSHETLDPLLLAETAELEILYPEPSTLKTVIKAWATSRNPAWAKMISALDASYNPIHNYNRSESWTEEREGESSKAGGNERESESSTTGSSSGTSGSSLTENTAGYNSSQANVPKAQSSATGSTSGQESTSIEAGQTDAWTEDGTSSESVTRSGTVSGNIGVTTNQQMIQAELELRRLDIYNIVIREFKTMFCLGVY